jgi:hypothetical protein
MAEGSSEMISGDELSGRGAYHGRGVARTARSDIAQEIAQDGFLGGGGSVTEGHMPTLPNKR